MKIDESTPELRALAAQRDRYYESALHASSSITSALTDGRMQDAETSLTKLVG